MGSEEPRPIRADRQPHQTNADAHQLVEQGPEQPCGTILLAEDDADFRRVLCVTLELSSYRVVAVGSGEQALALARSCHPDLVIADWGLPDLDGLELVRSLRSLPSGKDFKIILLTGRSEPADRTAAMQAGVDIYLVKPVGPSELLEILEGLR